MTCYINNCYRSTKQPEKPLDCVSSPLSMLFNAAMKYCKAGLSLGSLDQPLKTNSFKSDGKSDGKFGFLFCIFA